jgi:beta-phosphoglucomutase-like phosphatase (HAD superfamily)
VREAGILTALVTATERRLVEIAIATAGGTTSTCWSAATRWTRTKPDPEPYLRAASLLGVAH